MSCQPTDDCWDECQEICEEICEEGGHFEFCDCNHNPTDTPPEELINIADNGDNLKFGNFLRGIDNCLGAA